MNLQNVLLEQNKQWEGSFEAGIPRDYLAILKKSVPTGLIETVTGVRRSGKSTLLFQLINYLIRTKKVPPENILFVNFEDPAFSLAGNSAAVLEELFSQYQILKNPTGRVYIFWDEIQNINGWESWVRIKHDLDKSLKIYLTGSNSALLSSEFGTKLTGRTLTHQLFPFSFKEFLRFMDIKLDPKKLRSKTQTLHYLEEYAESGGFPEVLKILDKEVRRSYVGSFMDGVLSRDVIPRFGINDAVTLRNLTNYLVLNIGNLYNYSELGELLRSNENTVQNYLGFLTKAYLFVELNRFDNKIKKRIRYPKKAYLVDPIFRTALSEKLFDDKARLIENLVLIELLRRGLKPFYFRNGRGLDFVYLDKKGKLTGLNVCYSNEIPDREFDGFESFEVAQKMKLKNKVIVTQNTRETKNGVELWPIVDFLL